MITRPTAVDFIYMHGNLKLTRVFLQNHIIHTPVLWKVKSEAVGLITKPRPKKTPRQAFLVFAYLPYKLLHTFFVIIR